MSVFNILDFDGKVIGQVVADTEYMRAHYLPWQYIEVVVQPDIKPNVLSRFQFLSRFTDDELVGIYTAAKTSGQLEVYLAKLNAAQEVNLSLKDVVDGVNNLETFGLIGIGRAAEILQT